MIFNKETLCRIALSQIKGMNLQLVRHILDKTGNAENIFDEKPENLQQITGLRTTIFSNGEISRVLESAKSELEFIEKNKIEPIFFTDTEYPARLLECDDAPVMLYYRGNADLNSKRIISIVGTRHATNYGKGFCENLLKDLGSWFPDLVVVSGLAYGIDICAHREALKNSLHSIGVLAHGLNTIYPATHKRTAADMLSQGGLLTEYTSQQNIFKMNFVARNRIVAGLSDALIVVESAEKGGSLITAGIAGSYNRDVFALPGDIQNEYSKGCNRLILRNRAALITSAGDLTEALCWENPRKTPVQASLFPELDDTESLVMNVIEEKGECQINQLTVTTNLPASQILTVLLELEFKGLVRTYPGGLYRKA